MVVLFQTPWSRKLLSRDSVLNGPIFRKPKSVIEQYGKRILRPFFGYQNVGVNIDRMKIGFEHRPCPLNYIATT